ncbi:hypothetical protein ACT17Q_12715 [Cellulomonas sp. CW35]|uniref:hypothetical protein n=1 Tax=Cellulomonas sp. CW35 TaxID=3458249 RepID=UPI0040347B1D
MPTRHDLIAQRATRAARRAHRRSRDSDDARPIDPTTAVFLPGWRPSVASAAAAAAPTRPVTPAAVAPASGRPRFLDDLGERALVRRTLNVVKSVSCPVHGAPAGQPCWQVPSATTIGKAFEGVCAERLRRAKVRLAAHPTTATTQTGR